MEDKKRVVVGPGRNLLPLDSRVLDLLVLLYTGVFAIHPDRTLTTQLRRNVMVQRE